MAREVLGVRPWWCAFLFAVALTLGGAASATTSTQTVTYTVGTSGTEYHAQFSWTITNVAATGYFVDGSPWVKVAAGAQLIAVTPASELRTTADGFLVTINGSVKNPRTQAHFNPDSLEAYAAAKQHFDSRRIFLSGPSNQAEIDATFDFAANIGAVNQATGMINPVPLTAGDVIVTAKSQWRDDGPGSWDGGSRLPHVDGGRRTPIDRFGVLTVVAAAPTTPCFRPPLQWVLGSEATRPAPIPVSSVITNESALLHAPAGTYTGLDQLLTSPTFRDAGGILYQSSQAQHAISSDPNRQGSITYGATMALAHRLVLLAATDTGLPSATRISARNRLIQYGIDCHGTLMSLAGTRAGAGQRAAEMKPWIMLAGWWLNRAEMKNPYQAIRTVYAGRAIAALDDTAIGRMFFHDDHVARQVVGGLGLGSPYHQTWGPGLSYQVTSGSISPSVRLMDCEEIAGSFGRLDINGAFPHPHSHARKPITYYGCSLRIEDGAGAGSTVYRVIEVGDVNGAIGGFIKVDRPWQHGTPDPTSLVRMFPFQNGDFAPGLTADLGRWYYSTNGHNSLQAVDSLAPVANGYARTSFKALIVPYAALKRLATATGDPTFLRGSTWNLLSESIGGTGQPLTGGDRFGTLPDQDRIMNMIWSRYPHAGLRADELAVVQSWIGHDGTPNGFGFIDRSRLPGADPQGDGSILRTCEQAMELSDGTWTVATGGGDPLAVSASCVLHAVAWFSYEATESGIVEVDTLSGADFNTRLAVLSDCEATTLFGCNDDAPGAAGGLSALAFSAVAGQRYLIALGSDDPDSHGTALLTVHGPGHEGEPDPGDGYGEELGYLPCDLAPRIEPGIHEYESPPGLDLEVYPSCLDAGGTFNQIFSPVLMRFVPERGGRFVASTCDGTLADTRIVVVQGCDTGIVIACNDDAEDCWTRSEVTFDTEPGVEYVIIVGGKTADDAGWGMLNLHEVPVQPAPRRVYMNVGIAGIAFPGGTLTGIKPHDIIVFDQVSGRWAMQIDGSDVGLGSTWVIDALERLPDGSFVVSFATNVSIPGLVGGPDGGILVNRCDLVRFVPTSVGWDTSGTWHFWFDGSDVGLTTTGEDIDAVDVLPDGSVLISAKSTAAVPGLASVPPHSVMRFVPTSLGSVTAGTWQLYLDGYDIGFTTSTENLDAVSVRPDGSVMLSTAGVFAVTGVAGNGGDIVDFFPDTLGPLTLGWFNLWFDASANGFGASEKLYSIAEEP